MEKLVVGEAYSPVQRALLHQWQAEGYFLVFVGLLLGIGIGFNLLPLAVAVCLVLLAPLALTSLALRQRRFRLAAGSSTLGACVQGMMVFYLFPLLGAPGALDTLQGALIVLAVYPALVCPLACAALAAGGCGQALEEVGDGRGQRSLPGRGSPPSVLPGAIDEQPARPDEPPRGWSIRFARE